MFYNKLRHINILTISYLGKHHFGALINDLICHLHVVQKAEYDPLSDLKQYLSVHGVPL